MNGIGYIAPGLYLIFFYQRHNCAFKLGLLPVFLEGIYDGRGGVFKRLEELIHGDDLVYLDRYVPP